MKDIISVTCILPQTYTSSHHKFSTKEHLIINDPCCCHFVFLIFVGIIVLWSNYSIPVRLKSIPEIRLFCSDHQLIINQWNGPTFYCFHIPVVSAWYEIRDNCKYAFHCQPMVIDKENWSNRRFVVDNNGPMINELTLSFVLSSFPLPDLLLVESFAAYS